MKNIETFVFGQVIKEKELNKIARTHNVVFLNIRDDLYMCEIDRKEHYTLQKLKGKTERYKVINKYNLEEFEINARGCRE